MNDILLEFEENGRPEGLANVYGVAYSGGLFSQPWEDLPLVLDLDGLSVAPQIPLLLSHENHPAARLGVVSVEKLDGNLLVEGAIDQTTEDGRKIVEMGRNIPWQLSIGARVLAREIIGEEPVSVNGREFNNCVVIRRAILREISVVAVGADEQTELFIAAALQLNNKKVEAPLRNNVLDTEKENVKMNEEVEKMKKAEAGRIAALTACLSDRAEILQNAIAEGWSKEQAESVAACLKRESEKLAPAAPNIIAKESGTNAKVLQAALEMRAGIPENKISKDEQTLEAAHSLRNISLKEVAAECLRNEGKTIKAHFDSDMVKAAFSTASLPVLLGNVANKKIKMAFESAAPIAPRLCVEGDLSDYKLTARANVNDLGNLNEIEDGQEIPNGVLGESTAYNQVKSYAEIISIGHKMLANDELGEFLRLPEIMGKKAAHKVDQVYFARLMANPTQADGTALFAAGHGNYLSGAPSALSKDALAAAKAKLLKQTDGEGNPIAVTPRYLVVPPELETAAIELARSNLANGSTTVNKFLPAFNAVSEWGLEVVAAPYLSNPNYTNNSATGWYLIADPAQAATMELAYLRGIRAPIVEQADAPFNFFGLQFRVRFDFGIREQDTRGWVFATGAE